MNPFPAPRLLRLSASLALAVLIAVLALASCTSLAPHRTKLDDALNCNPINPHVDPQTDDSFGRTYDAGCADLIREVAPGIPGQSGPYTLHFAEFDDQGLLFPATPANGLAAEQTDRFLDYVRDRARKHGSEEGHRQTVVVFVHGWKHGAASEDSNVRWFRAMLAKLADVETHSSEIVGLYAGWRGDATLLPDLFKNATFWTRKTTAEQVAEGQVRELLSRLRSIQDINNETWNGEVERSRRTPQSIDDGYDPGCRKSMRLVIIGHSFGGLIVYNALSQALVRDIADLHERILDAEARNAENGGAPARRIDPVLVREGDLILTINPADQAARFAPLWRAARAAQPHSYHAPVFVSITSADDWATRYAFPVARFFNTLSNRYPATADTERDAATQTLGQDQEYVDYTLNTLSNLKQDKQLAGAKSIEADATCEALRNDPDFSARYTTEIRRLNGLEQALRAEPDANCLASPPQAGCKSAATAAGVAPFPRQFCIAGAADTAIALLPRNADVNLDSPIWNVYTSHPVLSSHSDLLNPILIDFLRQLYEEGTRSQLQRIR
ncbi:MAG: hypothetical protein QM741_17290 [Rudaea sp.]|uniref:hypothetical protein n=1 Tax=Rudaea sp. TaxID=2136325 RepID=UPI0039E298BA